MNYESPKLNLGEGFGTDVEISKFVNNFPPVRFTFFNTKEDYSDPTARIKLNDGYRAYFSFVQSQLIFSFFKDLDASGVHSIKVGIGAAYYDLYEAIYSNDNKLLSAYMYGWKTKPVIELDYNIILKDDNNKQRPILGLATRIFEERIKLLFWVYLTRFADDNHELRLETLYLSSPYFRDLQEWENKGGIFFQLRWRGYF